MDELRINDDFDSPAFVWPEEQRWVASPQGGVERIMLDRIGGEVARATSIVRYAPGSAFAAHRHPGGEEILVLSGVFSDDQGDYPAGWYLRNPPGSSHRPHSEPGATIFVKLFQMGEDEREPVRIDTNAASAWTLERGRRICPLYRDGVEHVFLEELGEGAELSLRSKGGLEVLVLSGALSIEGRPAPKGSWLRWPPMQADDTLIAVAPARVWVKVGLQDVRPGSR